MRIQCDTCHTDLNITKSKLDSADDYELEVESCQQCLQDAKEEAEKKGRADGSEEGHNEGYDEGYAAGVVAGQEQ